MLNFSLEKKLILITGASSGIGKESVIEFSKYNTKIALVARNSERLNDLKKILSSNNNMIEVFPFDLLEVDKIPQLIDKIEKKFSQSVDVLLNCAGHVVLGNVEHVPFCAYQKNLKLNFIAPVVLTQNVLDKMKKKKSGQIINLLSGAGKRGLPGASSYCASKFALDAFTESLRVEVYKYNIDVILISPGLVKTELEKRAKIYGTFKETFSSGSKKSANYVAKQIVKASLKRKRSVILSYKTLLGIYLNFFFPTFLDKFLSKKI